MTGARSKRVVVEPSLGLDFGVVRLGGERTKGRYLIVSSDPITGVRERAGWYAVNVSANDVATSGNRPEFMQSVILLPEDASERDVKRSPRTCTGRPRALGIAIVGGHTELSPGLRQAHRRHHGLRGGGLLRDRGRGARGRHPHDDEDRGSGGDGDPGDGRPVQQAARQGDGLRGGEPLREAQRGGRGGAAPTGPGPSTPCTTARRAACSAPSTRWRPPRGSGSRSRRRTSPSPRRRRGSALTLGVDPLKLISSGTLLIAVERGEEALVSEAVGLSRLGSHPDRALQEGQGAPDEEREGGRGDGAAEGRDLEAPRASRGRSSDASPRRPSRRWARRLGARASCRR